MVVVLLPALLAACGGRPDVQVKAAAAPPAGAVAPASPLSSFQGTVASVDAAAREFVVAVQIVWAPVLKSDRHDRRVLVEDDTRWEPPPGGIALLHAGDEVQVQAEELADGRWRAHQVQLFDVD